MLDNVSVSCKIDGASSGARDLVVLMAGVVVRRVEVERRRPQELGSENGRLSGCRWLPGSEECGKERGCGGVAEGRTRRQSCRE